MEFACNLSQSVFKVALARLYLNIRVIALDLKWMESHLPLQREGDGYRQGKTETKRVKLCNTRLHSADDSQGEGNFNSAAVAANKNLLINRDAHGIRACQ